MTDDLPAPLVPPDVDLKDFRFMPLDVVRLRDSTLIAQATGDEFRCAVLLWCAAWHQVPAGSLPDDDAVLAGYAGYGRSVKRWQKVRPAAMRGWVKCADGRLYHPVVCEKAAEAFDQKLRHFFRSELNRIKKSAERSKISPQYPTFDEWISNYKRTGSRYLEGNKDNSHNLSQGTTEGRTGDVPATPASNGPDRTGPDRTGEKSSCSSIPSASLEVSEQARALARAFGKGGYEVEPQSDLIQRYERQGVSVAEVEEAVAAAKRWVTRKPLAWVLSRIDGRRADGQGLAASALAVLPTVDPALRARRDADRKLEDALIEIRHMADVLGLLTPEQRQAREDAARAEHRVTLDRLGIDAAGRAAGAAA